MVMIKCEVCNRKLESGNSDFVSCPKCGSLINVEEYLEGHEE